MKILTRLSKDSICSLSRYRAGCISIKSFCNETAPKSMKELLRHQMKATGPLPVAKFMKEVLTNPIYGYYTTRDVIGRQGDFTTSPEISQIFSELIAVWFINEWSKVGAPRPFHFVELGPGHGTLIEGILKVFRKFKFNNSMAIHLIEVSPVLSNIQAERLGVTIGPNEDNAQYYKSGKTEDGIEVFWYKSIHDYKSRRFSLIVAHEFFDALPIHKFKKTEKGWCEVLVDIDYDDPNKEKFRYVLSSGPTYASKIFVNPSETRDEVEVNSESMLHMGHLASSMEAYGGIALVIDYGHCGTKTDTFRAFREHKQCDPLTNVGYADLTADVNFDSLIKAVQTKLITFGPVTQRQFLEQMQIDVRLEQLLHTCPDEKTRENVKLGYHALVDEDKMGSKFYFLSFFPAILREFLERHPVVGFLKDK